MSAFGGIARSLKLRGIMQPLWRILMASALALTGTAALAQSQPGSAPSSSAPSGDLIGPPQLSNFSLGGKVTQPAAPQPTQIQPVAKRPGPIGEQQTPDVANSPSQAAPTPVAAQTEVARRTATRASERKVQPRPSADELRAFTNPAPPPPQAAGSTGAAAVAQPAAVTAPPGGPSPFLWLLAAAAAAGAAAWYFLWQRPRTRLATAGIGSAFDAQSPERASLPPPVSSPKAAAPLPKSSGVVATRLRPWIELQFTPGRVILDDEKVLLEFEMALFNSGSAPARDILVEGSLFNAGPLQDQQISAFFEKPVGLGNRLPLLAPLQRLSIPSAITLLRSQLVPLEIEDRPLLVPLAGFNALYRWGSSSDGQTSASYLVGKQTSGEKLAPFRLDLAPRIFRKLAVREYEIRVRK